MPTSLPPRSTPRSRTSTSAACTSRPTRARTKRRVSRAIDRPGIGAVFFSLAIAIAFLASCGACDSGGDAAPTPTPRDPTATPRPASTGSNAPAARDLNDLARRYRNQPGLPRTVEIAPPELGDQVDFVLLALPGSDGESPGTVSVTATLRAATEHAYFFIEDGYGIGDGEVQDAADAFEGTIWPAVTGEFGPPPSPGVDGDPRITILHADLGPGLGGYVSGRDAYPATAVAASNGREMLYINVNARPLGSAGYTGLVAHEFHHLVHRRLDDDEESWVNEGLSEVAAALVGGGGGTYRALLDNPDLQLNTWPAGGDSTPSYDAAELFLTYLSERAGVEPGALARRAANGLAGVADALEQVGSPLSVGELAGDWAIANLLDLPDGPYGYADLELDPPALAPVNALTGASGEVSQFGADYLELTSDAYPAGATLTFEGDQLVRLLAAQPHGPPGETVWWSGRGDAIDSTVTRELDLTGVSSATLTFRTWFDIERSFDYGYVAVSSDDGVTWTALPGRHTTLDDPLATTYGPAYTGRSGGGAQPRWLDERIDLSAYAGGKVLLRFELINDEGVNQPGWAIDNIAVPEIGFLDNAESDPGGWHREGFRRIANPIPQRFELRVVTYGTAAEARRVQLDTENGAVVALPGLGIEYERAVIVIMGTTDGTTEPASYRYDVSAGTPAPPATAPP